MTAVEERAPAAGGAETFGFGNEVVAGRIPAPGEQLVVTEQGAKVAAATAGDGIAAKPKPKLTYEQRLFALADKKNTDWPMRIEGPNGEMYLPEHLVRAIAVAAKDTMGWCEHGVNSALDYMGMPKLRFGDNTGRVRPFTATVMIRNREAKPGWHSARVLPAEVTIRRYLDQSVANRSRDGQPWTYELGEERNSVRKIVILEGDREVSSEEAPRQLRDVTVHGWFQADSWDKELTKRDLTTIRNRVIQFLQAEYEFTTITDAGGYTLLKDVSSAAVEVKEDFSDAELLASVKKMLGGNTYNLRGYDR